VNSVSGKEWWGFDSLYLENGEDIQESEITKLKRKSDSTELWQVPTYSRVVPMPTSFCHVGSGQWKCDGTRAETRFRLSAKRTSPFISAGGGGGVSSGAYWGAGGGGGGGAGVSSVDYWQPRCAHQR
jgi:hypothetical protein